MTDRTKPGVAFWATVVAVVVLVAYPLSFGPACWIKYDPKRQEVVAPKVYWPLGWIMNTTDPSASNRYSVQKVMQWYIGIGVPKRIRVTVPTHYRDGNWRLFSS